MRASLAPVVLAAAPHAGDVYSRLHPWLRGDAMLREVLSPGRVRVAGSRLYPSQLDEAACAVARALINDKTPAVALAFPRGIGPHAAMLGLYLAMWRHSAQLRLCGSVSVATRQGDLAKALGDIRFEDAEFAGLHVGRVVAKKAPGSGGVDLHGNVTPPSKRAAMRPLPHGERVGLSQSDGQLLFGPQRPLPPMAENVVWAMVVDTIGAGRPWQGHSDPEQPDTWTRTWDDNHAAQRKQLWLGELGDRDFIRFCADRGMPLVQFDWPLIAACAAAAGRAGSGPLSSEALLRRSRAPRGVVYHLVEDAERAELVAELYSQLAKARRRGRSDQAPQALKTAYDIASRVSRMAAPSRYYEEQAARRPGMRTGRQLLDELHATQGAAFMGRHWKDAYNRYWSLIVSLCRRLTELAAGEHCAKYEALFERIAQAQGGRERLRVLCQSEAERRALKAAFDELDVDVPVVSFSGRLRHGDERQHDVTLLLAPPPPWQGHLLLSGESGRVEVLCYRHEVARLNGLTRALADPATVATQNYAVLDQLGMTRPPAPGVAPAITLPILISQGAVYGIAEPGAVDVDEPPADEPADTGLWADLIRLWGADLPEDPADADPDDEDDSAAGYGGYAHEVLFADGTRVLFRADGELDVLEVGEDGSEEVLARAPDELSRGDRVAFLPGAGRRSLLDILMTAHDERLATERLMLEPLYRNALEAAVERFGVTTLASMVGRERFSIWDWLANRSKPGDKAAFEALLAASGDDEAWRARAPIWEYLSHKRGVHRYIGRLMRDAIAETLADKGVRPALVRLTTLVRRSDLEDLFDQVEELEVLRVGALERVPLRYCGRYLDAADPTMAAFMRQRGAR